MLKKILIATGGFLLFVLVLLIFFLQFFANSVIEEQLDSFIASDPSEVYQFSYKKVKSRIGFGIISIEGLEVQLKDGAKDKLKFHNYKSLEEVSTSIELDLDLPAYLFDRKVVLEEIKILDPVAKVYVSRSYPEEEEDSGDDPSVVSDIFSSDFRGLVLSDLIVENATFTYHDVDSESIIYEIDSINIDFNNVAIDSITLAEQPIGIKFSDVKLETGGLSLQLSDRYRFKTQGIELELLDSTAQAGQSYAILHFRNFEYWPLEESIDSLRAGKLRSLFGIKVDSLSISDFNLDHIVENRIELKTLKISKPEFLQHVHTNIKKEEKADETPSKSGTVLGGVLEEIKIEEFIVEEGNLRLFDRDKDRSTIDVKDLDVEVKDLLVRDGKELKIQAESAVLNLDNMVSELNEYYTLNINKGRADLVNGKLQFQDIKMIPQYNEEEFFTRLGFETDRFTVTLDELAINNLNIKKIINDFGVQASDIQVNNLELDIYRNKWIEDPEFKYKPLPSQMIRNIPIDLKIDTVFLNDANITYRQLGDLVKYEDEKPMQIKFRNMNAKIFVLTNDRNYRKKYPTMFMTASMNFMDTTLINANYEFDMNSPSDRFRVYGDINYLHTKSLAPVLNNVLLLDIPEGEIYSGKFDMVGNDTLMTGTFNLEYENMAVDKLRQHNPDKSDVFMNALANTVIRKHNVKDRGKYIEAKVYAERKRNKSVFNFTWQGIKSGIIYTVSPIRTAKMKGKK